MMEKRREVAVAINSNTNGNTNININTKTETAAAAAAVITTSKEKQEISRAVKQGTIINGTTVLITVMAISIKATRTTQPNVQQRMIPIQKERCDSRMTTVAT